MIKTISGKICITIAVVAVMIYALAGFISMDNNVTKDQVEQTSHESILEGLEKMEGYYYLCEKNNGKQIGTIRTCQVKKFEGNTVRILITSDYDPEVYEFTYSEDGTLYSQEMGSGNMTYKKKLEKIVLTFKKGDTTWKFSK